VHHVGSFVWSGNQNLCSKHSDNLLKQYEIATSICNSCSRYTSLQV